MRFIADAESAAVFASMLINMRLVRFCARAVRHPNGVENLGASVSGFEFRFWGQKVKYSRDVTIHSQ
ncbi:MAG: hypothetical protein GJ671_01610 [Alteromonadaceae bacterium]|nr:hypothetical protein [Alteromonadaceae bacterium]